MATNSVLEETFLSARVNFLRKVKDPAVVRAISAATTIDDFKGEMQVLEAQMERNKKLRGLKRIEPFVNGLEAYAGVIEVFVQAKPEIISLIWGPLKFLLKGATSLINFFGSMLDVFKQIGRVLPQFKSYSETFNDNENIRRVLSHFYEEILELYALLITFMRHPGINTFTETLWPKVRLELRVIQQNIAGHESAMASHVTLDDVLRSQEERKRALEEDKRAEEARNRQYWKELRDEVAPQLYDSRFQNILAESSVESGDWLEGNKPFTTWIDSNTRNRCFWLIGMPGAGKTFIAANLIRRLQNQRKSTAFLFLSHHEEIPTRVRPLHSILFQVLSDEPALRPLVYQAFKDDERRFLFNTDAIRKLLSDFLQGKNIVVVVDGIDEVHETTRGTLLSDLLWIVESCPSVRLFISSRDDHVLKRNLSKAIHLRIGNYNSTDIKALVDFESLKLGEKLVDCGAAPEAKTQITESAQQIVEKADGMILYAVLVFRMAQHLGSVAKIQAEFSDVPRGLTRAYGRLLDRIAEKSSVLSQVANRILMWLAGARRTLREEELLQVLAVEQATADFTDDRRDNRDLLEACGHMIEVEDGFVRFVHFTAREFLLNKESDNYLSLANANAEIATTCTSYLAYESLDPAFSPGTSLAEDAILRGDFVLLEYSALHSMDHIRACGSAASPRSTVIDKVLLGYLHGGVGRYIAGREMPMEADQPESSSTTLLGRFRLFEDQPMVQATLARADHRIGSLKYGAVAWNETGDEPETFPSAALAALAGFREHLENMLCPGKAHCPGCVCDRLRRFYGPNPFYCTQAFCEKFGRGFSTKGSRDAHLAHHRRGFTCLAEGCPRGIRGFHSKTQLERHVSEHGSHQKSSSSLGTIVARPTYSFDWAKPGSLADIDVLTDAVESGQTSLLLDLLRNFSITDDLAKRLLPFAAWKATPTMLEEILKSSDMKLDVNLNRMLAWAIESQNMPNIKILLEHGADISASIELMDQSTYGEWAIRALGPLSKRRKYLMSSTGNLVVRYTGIERAISLLCPELMEFLVHDCGIRVIGKREDSDAVFRQPAINDLTPAEIRSRLAKMKQYIWLPACQNNSQLIWWDWPEILEFSLQNGLNPNAKLSGRSLLTVSIVDRGGRPKNVKALLRQGADPSLPSQEVGNLANRRGMKNLIRYFGDSWENIVKRIQAGEDIERVPPRQRNN